MQGQRIVIYEEVWVKPSYSRKITSYQDYLSGLPVTDRIRMKGKVNEMSGVYLTYDELVYLCVSLSGAKQVYGLAEKSAETRVDWKSVRQGLIENNFLMKDTVSGSDALLINPRLALMIETISWPKLYISVNKPSGSSKEHCFYFNRNFASHMSAAGDKNVITNDRYILEGYNDSEDVLAVFNSIIQWDEAAAGKNTPIPYSVDFTLSEYEEFLKTVRDKNRDGNISMLKYESENNYRAFPKDVSSEVYETLTEKKPWLSMIILTFDSRATEGKRVVEQSIIYEGKENMWDMEITKDGAKLFSIGKEKMESKLNIITSLFKYF